ncbi:MAG: sugar ABC transporter substrate-binding protein [Christensenella sp.]|uniref:sugar ABC transporter substrate-binding protein n=1 Tax=Christensenella sp. TaxID=1935934 RepID=UPI002B2102AB|nr:sugar ABC transporter substrate-binding protein [Christensenella sp.]MEA5003143.1 sugar ABC transporter substrate-binding protein [Christensenella sp.]
MKKLSMVLAVILVAVFMLAACTPVDKPEQSASAQATEQSTGEAAPASASAAADKSAAPLAAGEFKKLGLVHNMQSWQMYQVMEKAIKAQCDAAGVELVVADANGDANKQLQLIETMMNSGVNGIIVVTIDGPTLEDVAKRCTENGVALVSMYIELENATANMLVDEYKYGYAIGEMGAQYMAENFPGEEVEVALLRIHDYLPGIDRGRGMEDALKELFPTAKIVNDQNSVDVESAMKMTEAILAGNPNTRMFLADSDDTGAIGAYEVLKAKVKPEDQAKYCVIGADGVPQAFGYIKEDGMYRGTVALDNKEIGNTAFAIVADALAGKEFERVQYCSFEEVTKANADEYLKQYE